MTGYKMSEIKHVYCDISCSADFKFACFSARGYSDGGEHLDKYTGIFDLEQHHFKDVFNTELCEFMVVIYAMESVPKNWKGTIYSDHGALMDIWDNNRRQKVIGWYPREVRSRFHLAFNKVRASICKIDSVHKTDLDWGNVAGTDKKRWDEITMDQSRHLECDQDCKALMKDYKKMSTFMNLGG